MPFAIRDLAVLAHDDGFTLWRYRTADRAIGDHDYWNGAGRYLRRGDLVVVLDRDRPARDRLLRIAERRGDDIRVTDLGAGAGRP